MGKRDALRRKDIDERVEGTPLTSDHGEPDNRFEPLSRPALRLPVRGGPAAETGMLPAVRINAEGDDRSEAQDASRTTAESRAVPLPEREPSRNGRQQPLVLIIEDAYELAELIQLTLGRNQISSVIETHGQQALERYFALNPDVVLLDLGLPDMTGWKVLEAIRESAPHESAMPIVIVITAYGDAANRLVGKLQNVYGYLIKPFTSQDVARTVEQALNGKL